MSANDRIRIPLGFGPGLDRATGPMAVEPGAMEDLRNFFLLDNKLQSRKGFASPGTLSAPGVPQVTHVLGGQALRSEGVGIVVGWTSLTGGVQVFRVTPDGTDISYIGEWFVWNEERPPIIHLCECVGRVFMAHDEPSATARAATYVYDPITPGTGLFSALEDTFSDVENAEIRFRGVVSHLDYLFGWGYGTAEVDRPEMVRSSLPGEPRNFDVNHYFIAGDRRDPVLQCVPGAANLIVFKGAEWHAIEGYDRRTFGIFRRDPLHGLLAPRLAVNVSGQVFFWSPDGPRVTDGASPAVSLDIPLDLQGFEPDDLPPEGSPIEAFATYVWADRIVLFVFGRRAYALTVRVQGDWKWSYWTFPWDVFCAFTLWDSIFAGSGAGPLLGYPEWDDADPAGTFVDIDVIHHGQNGDERLEVWIRDTSNPTNPYLLRGSVDVVLTPTQTMRVGGLLTEVTYDGALRYRQGNRIHEAYTGDPATWPEVSRGTFTTTLNPPDVGVFNPSFAARFSGLPSTQWTWERTSDSSQRLQFRVFPGTSEPGHLIRLYRRVGSGSFTLLDELEEGVDFHLGSLGTDGGFTYADIDPPQGDPLFYRASSVVGMVESPQGDPLRLWPGPIPHSGQSLGLVPASQSTFMSGLTGYEHRVTAHRLHGAPGTTAQIRLFDNWNDNTPGGAYTAEPDQERNTEYGYELVAEPSDQQPPTFGATSTLAVIPTLVPFENPLTPGILQVGIVYTTFRFGEFDHSEMFIEHIGV